MFRNATKRQTDKNTDIQRKGSHVMQTKGSLRQIRAECQAEKADVYIQTKKEKSLSQISRMFQISKGTRADKCEIQTVDE